MSEQETPAEAAAPTQAAPQAMDVDAVLENARGAQKALMSEKPAMPSANASTVIAGHFARAANFEAMAAACLMGKGPELVASMSQGYARV